MRPLYGDTQPVVAGSPTPRPNQHIVLPLIQELTVDLFYMVGYDWIIDSRKVVIGFYIDHIHYILRDTMPKRVIRAEQAAFIGNLQQILVKHLLTINNRADL